MKKSTIWIIAIVMGLAFLGLLYLQFSYVEEMVTMKKEQFDESVNRSLYQASRNLEMNETLRYLEKDVQSTERRAFSQDSVMVDGLDGSIRQSHQFAVAADDGTVYSSFQLKTFEMKPSSVPKAMILRKDKSSLSEAAKSMQEIVRQRYVYQKALLDEVVYNILYTASDKPLKERVNFRMLDQDIRAELMNNGVNIPYHFTVSTSDGREVYRCPDYDEEGEKYTYTLAGLHAGIAHHVHLHHRAHLPSEALYRDQERFHQQYDPRVEDTYCLHLAGCTDDERRQRGEGRKDGEALRRSDS